jgi:F-type H+-transporting ATPase subunit gamma
MPNTREVRLRIRSIKNIAQVTRALQAVSASKVRKAMQAVMNTRPYATKAWQVLTHIAGQPGRDALHHFNSRSVKSVLVLMVREIVVWPCILPNIVRFVYRFNLSVPVRYPP